jgi:predicted enzyme related to lactoylglutathione lyase
MTDPLDALRAPVTPIDPDPRFAARLRRALERALGGDMTEVETTTSAADPAWPPTLTPYIAVRDGRRALRWYADVFGAERRGDPYVGPDGSIGHAELRIGDAVLMLSEGSTQVPVQPPAGGGTHSHTLHVQVDDVDSTIRRARELGASVEREPVDESYGRVAVIVDPFGHRWMLNRPPGRAARERHGDVAYVTMAVPDGERAKSFYGAVLGWRFSAGSTAGGWNVDGVRPMVGLAGGNDREVQLCYRVSDIETGVARVRAAGGQAGPVERKPYGLLADCVDDQGARFQLWQPVD